MSWRSLGAALIASLIMFGEAAALVATPPLVIDLSDGDVIVLGRVVLRYLEV